MRLQIARKDGLLEPMFDRLETTKTAPNKCGNTCRSLTHNLYERWG